MLNSFLKILENSESFMLVGFKIRKFEVSILSTFEFVKTLDEQYMQRALKLAQMGKFYAAPNPRVGAVIVHNEKIIGEGFHRKFGKEHAEVNAINAVKDKTLLSESTIYVTLEPCSHTGKTPPCADLIIRCNFKRVVICNQDPYKKVDGSGIKKLKKSGIKVEVGCLKSQGLEINKRFFTFHTKNRPYIILKWAESKDKFLAKNDGKQNWISNSISKQLVHAWRAEESAILVGKNTVLIDNPELTTREVKGRNPTRIVIDEKLELNQKLKIFNAAADTIILNSIENRKSSYCSFIMAELRENLPKVLAKICHEQNLQSVIIEGGANILNQFIARNMWDEARVFTGSVIFKGGIPAPKISKKQVIEINLKDNTLAIYKNHNL